MAGVGFALLFTFLGVPHGPPLSEGGVRLQFRPQRTTEIVQFPLAGGLRLLQSFLGFRSRREPVLRQRTPGLLASTVSEAGVERRRFGP